MTSIAVGATIGVLAVSAFSTPSDEVRICTPSFSSGHERFTIHATQFPDAQAARGSVNYEVSDLERIERITEQAFNSPEYREAAKNVPATFTF